jgi:hypothetical protein
MTNHEIPPKVIDLIKKIRELSERGVAGEAEAATRKLNEILAKYKVSLDDIAAKAVKTFPFVYKGEWERKLIIQCYTTLNYGPKILVSSFRRHGAKRAKANVIGLDMTTEQYVDLSGMIDFYKVTWALEVKRLFSAFIHRHNLFPPDSEADPTHCDPAELLRVMAIMRGLGEKSYQKPLAMIEQGKENLTGPVGPGK